MFSSKKHKRTELRRLRIRNKVKGTSDRPRMSVSFTNENIYVQFIDDAGGRTLASASTRAKSIPDRSTLSANVKSAKRLGALAAEVAKSKGIEKVVFDRRGAKYHGKVKALADAAREAGMKF